MNQRTLTSIGSTAAVAALLGVAGYAALYIAPEERTMGAIQRIFYFHVSSGWTAGVACFIAFVANIAYLSTRKDKWDWLAVSAVEVGVAFCSVLLVTGPIWAHPVWGIWWTWDARLTLTFVAWLMYVAYLLLRTLLPDRTRRAMISAVYGIFVFVVVPIDYMAIRWWRTQHPQAVFAGGAASGIDPTMWKVTFFCWGTMLALMALLLWQRYSLEALRFEAEELRFNWESSSEPGKGIR
ncbi:MAG: cytochrome c biogenesis protein CcsA [Acidobacteria bacterium]|nr:cytochrome c biogenesis protein CcsA [Acidobacteriota bacterium]